MQRKDGKWFGFDQAILARKRGQYIDRMQFRAQYYNDPSDPDSQPLQYSQFQYFDKRHLKLEAGNWYYKGKKLNLVAAVDFAYSTSKRSDYTAIVVVGVDADNLFYVLDMDRFQTDGRISVYFQKILDMYNKWNFRKLRAESTAAQQAIIRSLKEDYIVPHGLVLKVEEVKPTRHQGSKQERVDAILLPRYENQQVLHYKSGNTQLLEEELISRNPAHDDLKDALATAIEGAVKPAVRSQQESRSNIVWNTRFRGAA
jgi:phage terminase large subunit-like protein